MIINLPAKPLAQILCDSLWQLFYAELSSYFCHIVPIFFCLLGSSVYLAPMYISCVFNDYRDTLASSKVSLRFTLVRRSV